jgi:hypothetical protein
MISATPSPPKKPKCHFTIEFRLKLLAHLSNVNNISQCAREYGIDRRSIGKWKAQEADIKASTHKWGSFCCNNNKREG